MERPPHPVVAVEIAVVYDTAGWARPRSNVDYLLPGSGFNDRCTVTLELGAAEWRALPLARNLLGPCAYYEAFGRPGPAIDRWLRARGWMFGRTVSWRQATPWLSMIDARFPTRAYGAFDAIARQSLSIAATRCATGDVDQCELNVLQGAAGDAPPIWGPGFMTPGSLPAQMFSRNLWLGPAEGMLLSEMVRTLGPDRFAQFWRSDLDPAPAFRAAAGESIGEWTRDWMQREYGKQTRGPTMNYAGFGLTGIALVLALAFGFRAVQTRRVG